MLLLSGWQENRPQIIASLQMQLSSLTVFANAVTKILDSVNKVNCYNATEFMLVSHCARMQSILMIGNDIILDEDKFFGDTANLWHQVTQLKAITFKFMKLTWLFGRKTECLPIVLDMVTKQTRRSNESLTSLVENQ